MLSIHYISSLETQFSNVFNVQMEWLRGTLSVDSRMRTIRIGFPVCWSCVEQAGTPVQVLMCCVRS